ncbi:zinc finger, CCHC-type containing protein [Tanacetum coccineum]|uniref:Zinc finger, CCHC-type containing protein n=1 Tax=Tanacetum coccineum TaxID=301880 RepID=A0ABQ4Y655_9ASTR
MVINSPCLTNKKELTSPKQIALGKDLSNPLMADSLPKTIWLSMHHVIAMKHWLFQGKRKLTATVKTVNEGKQKITITVDGHTFAITEASVRRHLQLADADGLSSLPNTGIFEQLTLMGYVSDNDKLTFKKGVHVPLFDTMLIHDQPGQGEGPTLSVESQHTPIASPSTSHPTTSQPMSQQEQPSQVPTTEPITRGYTPRSVEDSMQLKELTKLCTKLFDRVTNLENDLKQTKKVHGKALTKLVKKVKHLKDKLKSTTVRRKARMVISDEEEELVSEDPSKQERKTEIEHEDVEKGYAEVDYELDQTEILSLQMLPEKKQRPTLEEEEVLTVHELVLLEVFLVLLRKFMLDERKESDDIDWNTIVEQVQERQSGSIKRYQTLKKKPLTVSQARKNIMIYLKNLAGYQMGYFKGMSDDEIRPIFEKEYNKVQTLFKKDTEIEKTNKKRVAEETLLQESFKKLRTTEASRLESIQEQPTEDPKELSEEDLEKMSEIVPVEEVKEAVLQVKYPIIDWEIHTEGKDLVTLWSLVKERFRSAQPTEDTEKALWVELRRLFELDKDDTLWKLQRYMHDPLTWRLYGSCAVHHVSLTRGHDIYILTEKDYPVSIGVIVEHISSSRYNDNNGKRKHHDNIRADPNKKAKPTCWKCGKTGHIKMVCKGVDVGKKKPIDYYVTYEAYIVQDDDVAWWVDSGARVHVCKDRCWFKTYESLNDGSILHMGNESTILVHGHGCVDLRFSSRKIVSLFNVLHVSNLRNNLVSSSILNNCGYKQVIESNKFVLSKHGVLIGFGYLSNQMFRLNIVNDNIASTFMSTSKLNDLITWHARLGHVHFKRLQDMSKDGLIPALDIDIEKCKTCMLTNITKKLFQNVKCETKVLELIHNELCDLHATSSLRNKKYFMKFIDDASRAVVRLLNLKLKTLGERGIECIFVGYAEHSKAFRFFVIEPNETVSINSVVELKDAIFDENRFSLDPRLSLRIPNGIVDTSGSVVPEKDDPKTFDEAMKSQDVTLWKEVINDEIDSIMSNNTWVLADLPPGCKPLGCKWIFKRKIKVDGTIEKFKAMLVIQGFGQKSRIDYFDTYAPVARISTIRVLIAIASIHNMIIHHMDVNTSFLNGELDDEFYMNQPQGFIMPGNENKVCKLIKSFYELKQTLNQGDKCVYSKFDESGKGVIICLSVDDMLIFGTDQDQTHYIKKVLKKFNYFDCTPVSTPMDTSEKLMPNNVGKLNRYTSKPGTQHCQANQGLGGGAISWASKKQTCITGSTMESKFVALAAVYKEAEWLRNLILEIPLWSKPTTPISIRCDGAAILEKAYS